MFTSEHFIWIALCVAFVTVMLVLGVKKKWRLKKAGVIMSIICLLSETTKVMSSMLDSPNGGMHMDPLSLPFHLCSLMIIAVLYITFGKEGRAKRLIINFVSVMGTLGSICAILIPTNGTDFTTTLAYQCFVYHAGLLWFSLYLLISGEAKLTAKSLLENIGILLALAFIMLYVNSALSVYDTNFFYLTRPPMENLPFLNLNHGWYAYLGRMLLLGIAAVSLFHLPFICKKKTTFENTGTVLRPLEPDDREQFILDNQAAFNYGALTEFGLRDDHFEEDGQIISREVIENCIDEGVAYRIVTDGEITGGLVLKLHGNRGELELLFVNPNVHSKGIGYAAWTQVERLYPQVNVWECVTPYFETRNIHFYVNRCGFQIVEYYNQHHPDPNDPDAGSESSDDRWPEGMFRFEKRIKP